eukprot:scaffold75116_cov63-Phaeocystis_antarctica.AAC.4
MTQLSRCPPAIRFLRAVHRALGSGCCRSGSEAASSREFFPCAFGSVNAGAANARSMPQRASPLLPTAAQAAAQLALRGGGESRRPPPAEKDEKVALFGRMGGHQRTR